MKKLFTLFLFVFCSAALWAQSASVHTTVKDDMRIFVKDGEEVLTSFPSKYLKTDVKIGVVFPKGYAKSIVSYPAVYIVGENLVSKKQAEEDFYSRKADNPDAVIISIISPLRQPSVKELGEFLTLEVLPYFELNYKISANPKDRVVALSGPLAIKGLEMLALKGDYFKNAAFILFDTTPLPKLEVPLQDDVTIWAAGSRSNMIRLQAMLESGGFNFPTRFAYKFASESKNKNVWSEVNLNYLLNPSSRKVKKAQVYTSLKEIPLSVMPSFDLWLNVGLKGYDVNYVPAEIKTAPPFFNWDFASASLTPIYGAEEGPVTVFGTLPTGKPFTGNLKIIK